MSKLALLLVLVILLPAYVLATDIGYIVKNTASPDNSVISAIEELGYTYSLIDDSQIPSTNFSDYEVILVWDETLSNVDDIPITQKKSLVANTYYLDDWKIADYAGSQVSSGYSYGRILTSNIITQGLTSPIQLYNSKGVTQYHLPLPYRRAKGIQNIVSTNDNNPNYQYPIIGIINPGGQLYPTGSGFATERTAFFGITETDYWTAESKILFKNTLTWVFIGEDGDGDGFHYDYDCNDSNAEVWQNLPGYIDNDNDSYGTGSLLEVCSGNELPEGYSEINGDCNDSNVLINPDSEETPYNSIDEDCDGFDLADIDNDRYCKAGYNIQNKNLQCPDEQGILGTDCGDNNELLWQNLLGYLDNDEDGYGTGTLVEVCSGNELLEGYSGIDGDCDDDDTTINPGSEDVYKNCKNDAPIIEPIGKITVQETKIAEINVSASDPENDSLTYEINDTRFIQDTTQYNIFIWQTDYEDYGNYFFTITVSDGDLESQIEVEVKVTNLNRAPICDEILEILDLEWNEDTTAELNLSTYCYDLDGEAVGFYFNETSSDQHITLESLDSETGIAEFSVEENWNGEDWIIFKVSDGKDYTLTNKVILNVLPVDDEPVFTGKIENITWNEDSNLIDYINLNNYFSDADNDSLSYDVAGDHFIDIIINNGLVSFYPQKDWYGEENVVFSASDNESFVYSNAITLKVLNVNDPPEFGEMECETEILEDVEKICEIKASDPENDSITLSIVNENKLQCNINNNTLEYVSNENYFGAASCLIRASDGYGYSEYSLEVNVLPVNDKPVFTGKIENITWNEDTNLTNYTNLNNYFSDADNDSLSYDVAGNHFIDIIINNGLVSFYPQKDWHEEENVVFSASDGEFSLDSNEVILSVNDTGEPPEFKEMKCETEILEDSEENCLLNVTDFENDSISFSVENENKLNCKIEEDKIVYKGFKDYNGDASCLIRARDKDGYADYTLKVVITPVNDAPVIIDYSPKGIIRLLENTTQEFRITASDVDNDDLEIRWFLDEVEAGSGSSYTFNQEKGNYNLTVLVTDGIENVSHSWDVFVGSTLDFTCSEIRGYVCKENEMCRTENLISVKDTDSCCSIPCSPSFSKTERCKNLSGSVEVEIEKPDEDEEFMTGDIIDVKVDVSNREENDNKFKVNAYLYDLTKDRKVEDDDDSVRIGREDTETVKFEFKVEEDIDEDKNYAIFVSAIDQDGEFCNEDYVEINIEREEEVVIKEFNMPEIVKCENSFDIEAKVKNIGRDDEENVYVVIENQELGIHEKSEEFKLEEYEEDDEAVKYFTIKNPQNISGSYIIKASVFFNGESNSQEKEIVFEECKKIEVTKEEIGKIFLEGKTEGKEVKEQNNKKLIILLLISMFFVLIAIIFLFYLISKARKTI